MDNTAVTSIPMKPGTKFQSRLRQLKRDLYRDRFMLMIFSLPLAYYIIFKYLPMYGIIISFMDYYPLKGIKGSEWVGLKHYIDFFNSVYFSRTVINTLVLNLYQIMIAFPMPIIFALLLNEVRNSKFKKTIQTISYLPYFISMVVVVGLFMNFLSPSTGIVNQIIAGLGLEPVFFLAEPKFFPLIYTIMYTWKMLGWDAVIYLAALTTIDVQQYEATIIDGATKLQQVRYITIPGITNTIVIMFLVKLGSILNVEFESILLMYNPAIYSTADVISTFVYRKGIVDANYSFATAVNVFQSVIGFVLLVIGNKLSNKYTESGLW